MSKKILIVEDEPALISALADTFSREGFDIEISKDGKEGLENACRTHPDVILLDLLMPVMDGMTMLNKLREDPWGKDAKVIILTNLSDSAKESKSNKQGVNEYLIKSNLNLCDIVEKVRKRLA